MRVEIDKKKNIKHFCFNGNLKNEVALCVKELEKKEKELPIYELIYEKAYREYKRKFDRVNDLNDFIKMALEKIQDETTNENA